MKAAFIRRLTLAAVAALVLPAVGGPPVTAQPAPLQYHPGPFTIRGLVLSPEGAPVAGYPVKLLPTKPERGLDKENAFYRIPGRNIHYAVTGPDGRFEMTGVVDYPQVATHTYRIVRAGAEDQFPYDQEKASDTVHLDRCTDPNGVIRLTIRLYAISQVKIVLKGRDGRPFTGSRVVSLVTEGGRPRTLVAEFTDGVACLSPADNTVTARGKVVVLRYADALEAFREAEKHGDRPGPGKPLTYGALGQQELLFVPGRTVTMELVAP
ncbi:MAG: hypothetical protein ACM3RP_09215 [Chitinophagales bacterium]